MTQRKKGRQTSGADKCPVHVKHRFVCFTCTQMCAHRKCVFKCIQGDGWFDGLWGQNYQILYPTSFRATLGLDKWCNSCIHPCLGSQIKVSSKGRIPGLSDFPSATLHALSLMPTQWKRGHMLRLHPCHQADGWNTTDCLQEKGSVAQRVIIWALEFDHWGLAAGYVIFQPVTLIKLECL